MDKNPSTRISSSYNILRVCVCVCVHKQPSYYIICVSILYCVLFDLRFAWRGVKNLEKSNITEKEQKKESDIFYSVDIIYKRAGRNQQIFQRWPANRISHIYECSLFLNVSDTISSNVLFAKQNGGPLLPTVPQYPKEKIQSKIDTHRRERGSFCCRPNDRIKLG